MSSTFGDGNEYPDAPAWKPSVGDVIFGEVVGTDGYESDYSDDPAVVLELLVGGSEPSTMDGKAIEPGTEMRVFCFGAYLQGDVKKLAPGIGDLIGIKRYADAEEATKPGYAKAKRCKMKVISRAAGYVAPAAPPEPGVVDVAAAAAVAAAAEAPLSGAAKLAISLTAEPDF